MRSKSLIMSDINFENNENRESTKFPCPSCGANMHFDPEKAALKCDHCDNVIDFEKKDEPILEYDFFSLKDEHKNVSEGDVSLTIQCESCGAKTIVGSDTISKFCAFCGSSHIISLEEMGGIPPESVIPFQIPEKKATDAFKAWVKKRWFAPSDLKKQNLAGKLNGVYVPYWTYDADTYYSYTAQAGKYYYVTKTRTVNGKKQTYQERHTRWYSVSGSNQHYFDDLQIQASKEIDYNLLEKIEPFTLSKLTPYMKQFLSGFLAERYSVDVKDGWEDAKGEINRELEMMVRESVLSGGADEVRDVRIAANYKTVKYKHILVPRLAFILQVQRQDISVYDKRRKRQSGRFAHRSAHGRYSSW